MSKFIDVVPSHFAFDDIEELYQIQYESGTYFFSGVQHNVFTVAPLDVDITALTNGQSEFILNAVVQPSAVNPLVVYVDGVELGYDSVKPNQPSAGKTYVKLRRGVRVGGKVRFYMAGVPAMRVGDPLKRPVVADMSGVELPNCLLPVMDGGSADPFVYEFENGVTTETLQAGGRQLKRVNTLQEVRENENAYTVANGRLYVHYDYNRVGMVMYYNVNNTWVTLPFKATVTPISSKMVYSNRFFPDTIMTRGEAISIVNRLRKDLIRRYTDQEPAISSKITPVRFSDVPQKTWYLQDVLDLEDAKLADGSYLLMPKVPAANPSYGELRGNEGMTRAEAVKLFNDTRKYFVHVIGR